MNIIDNNKLFSTEPNVISQEIYININAAYYKHQGNINQIQIKFLKQAYDKKP
jgi:hypothetical protein